MSVTNYCECDNTHEANDTVCQWCHEHGRRNWSDPDVVLHVCGGTLSEKDIETVAAFARKLTAHRQEGGR